MSNNRRKISIIGNVQHNINFKKDGKIEKILAQTIKMIKDEETDSEKDSVIIKLSYPVEDIKEEEKKDEEGKKKEKNNKVETPSINSEKKELLSVVKNRDGDYYVEVQVPDLFKNEKGAIISMQDGIAIDGNGKLKLKIDKDRPSITFGNKKDSNEFEIVVESEDSKKYVITAKADKVTIKYGEETFSYNLPENKKECISAQISTTAFEGMLSNDEESKVFAKPEDGKIQSIPSYLFGMYFSGIEENKKIELGDKTLYAVNPTGQKGDTTYFVSQLDNKNTKHLFMYNKGKFEEVKKFFFQHEDKEEGKGKRVSLVIQGGSTSAPIYYNLECGEIEAGSGNKKVSLSNEGKESIEFFRELDQEEKSSFHYTDKINKDKDGKDKKGLHSVGDFDYKTSAADGRKYTKHSFLIKENKFDAENDLAKSGKEEEKGTEGKKSEGKGEEKEEDKENEEKDKNEDEKDKEDDGTKTVKIGKEIDLRKPVEALGNSASIVGAFLMVGALIPGVGLPLALAGMSMFLAGTGASYFSNKFIFSPYEKTIRDYKKQKFVDHNYEDFFEKEDSLDNALEGCAELEKDFVKIPERNSIAKELKEQIEKNGISQSFEEMVLQKSSTELNNIVSDMRTAANTKKTEEKNKAITNFINNNFKEVNAADKATITSFFDDKNKRELSQLISEANTLIEAHKKAEEIENEQKRTIMSYDDEKLSFIIGNKDLTKEKRKAFFERYGSTLVKNIALDEVSTEKAQKMFRFIKDEDEKVDLMGILKEKADNLQKNLASIESIAIQAKVTEKNITNLKNYKEVKAELDANKENYNLTVPKDGNWNNTKEENLKETNTSELIDNFLSSTSLVMFDNIAKNANLDKLTEIETESTPLAKVSNTLAKAIREATFSDVIANKYKEIEEISKEMGLTQELNDFYFKKYLVRNVDKNKESFAKLVNNDDKYKDYRNEKNPDQPNLKLFIKENSSVDSGVYPDFETPPKDASLDITYPAVLVREAKAMLASLEKTPENKEKIEKYQKIVDLYDEINSKENFNINLDEIYKEMSKELSIDEKDFENDENLKNSYSSKLASLPVDDVNRKDNLAKIYAISEVNINSLNTELKEIENDIEKKKEDTRKEIEEIKKDTTLSKTEKEHKINTAQTAENEFIEEKNNLIDEKNKDINYYNKFTYFADSIISGINISKLTQVNSYFKSKGENVRVNKGSYQDTSLKNLYKNYDRIISKKALLSVFDKETLEVLGDTDNLNTEELKNALDNSIGNQQWEANQPLNKEMVENEAEYNNIVNSNIAYIRASNQMSSIADEIGKNIAQSELDYSLKGKKDNSLETYDNCIELLVKRFGVDKIKLLDQIAKEKDKPENIEDSALIKNILGKFGIDMEKIKIICAEKKVDLTIKKLLEKEDALSEQEKERIAVIKEKEHFDEIESKKETLSTLIEKAKSNGNFKFIEAFLNDEKNQEFLSELNVAKAQILEILNKDEFREKDVEDRIEEFNKLDETLKIVDSMNETFARKKNSLDEKEINNLKTFVETLPYNDKKINDLISEAASIEQSAGKLKADIEKIMRLQNVYDEKTIEEILKAFVNGDKDSIDEIIELKDLFDENDFNLIKKLKLSKSDFKLKNLKKNSLNKLNLKIIAAHNRIIEAKEKAKENTKSQEEKKKQEEMQESLSNNRNKNLKENASLLSKIFGKFVDKAQKEKEKLEKQKELEKQKQKVAEQGYQMTEEKAVEAEEKVEAELLNEEGKTIDTVEAEEKV